MKKDTGKWQRQSLMKEEEYNKMINEKELPDMSGYVMYTSKNKKTMEDNKYYVPLSEELYIGYECETCILPMYEGDLGGSYSPTILDDSNIRSVYDEDLSIRTKYLSKEQIEAEGWRKNWKDTDNYEGCYIMTTFPVYEGAPSEEWELWKYDKIVNISNECSNRCFDGECKSINELRKIMKWIGIK